MDIKQAIKEVQQGTLTGTLTSEQVAEVIKLGVPKVNAENGRVNDWQAIEDATGVNYNRGWLLVREAFLLINNPTYLVDLQALVPAAQERQAAVCAQLDKEIKACKDEAKLNNLRTLRERSEYDFKRHVVAQAVMELREQHSISWGEISVRLRLPESTCRNAFNTIANKKDKGLRIGKGGRWAYGAGELYMDNRRKEGAQIPTDFKGRPKPEDLMNFVRKEGEAPKAQNKRYRDQVQKLINKAYDSSVTPEEADAFKAKIAEVCEKYGFKANEFTYPKARTAKAS